MVLWSGCFTTWIEILTRDQVNPDKWTDCKLGYFLFFFGSQYSSTLLVLMSIEKCFAIYFPLKSKTVCTVRTAKYSTGILGFIIAGYNIQWFFLKEPQISEWSGHYICVDTKHYSDSVHVIDSVLYSFGPFVSMSVINFAIALKFIRAKCKSIQSNSTESTNQALSKSATRGTAMVVTVSVMFLILTAPTAVNDALYHMIQLDFFPLYHSFMNLTQYLNHSVNGVLYCIVGTRFRRELVEMLCRSRRPQGTFTTHSVITSMDGNGA